MNLLKQQSCVFGLSLLMVFIFLSIFNIISDGFPISWTSFNPIHAIEQIIFFLSFGLGLNILSSAFIVVLLLTGLFILSDWIFRKLLGDKI